MSQPFSSKERQRERRLYLWRLWNLGHPLRECVQQTADVFHCSERLVYYDWANRAGWLCREHTLYSKDRFNIDMLSGLMETLRQTQAMANDERAMANPAVRLGRLKLLRSIYLDLLKHGSAAIHDLMTGQNYNPLWTPSPLIRMLDSESTDSEAAFFASSEN